MDLDTYHNAWMRGLPEHECEQLAEEAGMDLKQREHYERLEREHYEKLQQQSDLEKP